MTAHPEPDWVVPLRSEPGASARVVGFPFVAAGASVYREWIEDMPAGLDLAAIRLPGRERRHREPLPHSVVEVAVPIARQLATDPRPCVLVGVCSGAVLAFETARRLETLGAAPTALLVASRAAPGAAPATVPLARASRAVLFDWLTGLGAVSPELTANEQFAALFEPVVRADLNMLESYDPGPVDRVSIPMIAVAGVRDREVPAASVEAWNERTTGDFTMLTVDADHFLRGPGRATVMAVLADRLRYRRRSPRRSHA